MSNTSYIPTTGDLFKLSNDMGDYAGTNTEGYKEYLATASRCGHYTVANQLLIQAYLPYVGVEKALDIRDRNAWAELGIYVKADARPIYVMEHDPENKKQYKPREVFDISQTNAVYNYSYDSGFVTEVLLKTAPCRIEYMDDFKVKGTKSIYRADRDVIEVTKGFKNFPEIIASMSEEYAHYFFAKSLEAAREKENSNANTASGNIKTAYPRAAYTDLAYAASCMVSHYYNTGHTYEINAVPYNMANMSTNERKQELARISAAANFIIKETDKELVRVYEANQGVDLGNAR